MVFSHFNEKSCTVICKYSHTHLNPDVLRIGSNTDGRFMDRKKCKKSFNMVSFYATYF